MQLVASGCPDDDELDDGAPPLARCVLDAELSGGARGALQAVLLDGSVDTGRWAEALLEVLAGICQQDPEAQCLLLCERQNLHGPDFVRFVHGRPSLGSALEAEDVLRRIHIKYVFPPADALGTPAVIEVLAGLHNLPFVPSVIAVMGLAKLTRGPRAVSGGGNPEEEAAVNVACRRGLLGVVLDTQHFALAAALLADAAAQAGAAGPPAAVARAGAKAGGGRRSCGALLWEARASAEAQLGLLGSVFDYVWAADWGAAQDLRCARLLA